MECTGRMKIVAGEEGIICLRACGSRQDLWKGSVAVAGVVVVTRNGEKTREQK